LKGEEEVGSSNLAIFVANHKEKLANDIILISDTGMNCQRCFPRYDGTPWD